MAVNIEGRLLKPFVNNDVRQGPLINQLHLEYPKEDLVYLGEYGPYSEFYLVDSDKLRLQNNYTGNEFNVVPRKLINDHDNYYKVVPTDESDVFDTYTLKFSNLPNKDNMNNIYIVDAGIEKSITGFKACLDYKTAFKYAGYVLDEDVEEK